MKMEKKKKKICIKKNLFLIKLFFFLVRIVADGDDVSVTIFRGNDIKSYLLDPKNSLLASKFLKYILYLGEMRIERLSENK